MKATKLIDRIKLDNYRKYNQAEVLIDSDNSDASELIDNKELHIQAKALIAECQFIVTESLNILNKLYISCMESKLTYIVK